LTTPKQKAYSARVKAKSLAGSNKPEYWSAKALTEVSFFCTKKPSYGGLCGGSSERRFSGYGLVGSAQSAPSCPTTMVAVLK